MLSAIRQRMKDKEDGFTLIELMVVVLIIAILIAIAIPTFLGARSRAQDRAAQSDIRNAFTAEKVFYTDAQKYTASSVDLNAIEPSLTFVSVAVGGAVGTDAVYVHFANPEVVLAKKSASGKCFYLMDSPSTGTKYASNTTCAMLATTGVTGAAW